MSSSASIVTSALVAQSLDYGEADRVVTLLTLGQGKVSAIARSARRSRRRFGAALSLFVVGDAVLRPRQRSHLMVLERFDSREDLATRIGADMVKVAHGSYMLELARELWPAGQQDREMFDLVLRGLRALAASDPLPMLLRAFELQMLGAVGLAPALQHCVRCGGMLDASTAMAFSVTQGGGVCSRCGPQGWPLPAEVQRLLLQLSGVPLSEAGTLEASGPARREARDLLVMLVQHHLGKRPRSLEFLGKLAESGALTG